MRVEFATGDHRPLAQEIRDLLNEGNWQAVVMVKPLESSKEKKRHYGIEVRGGDAPLVAALERDLKLWGYQDVRSAIQELPVPAGMPRYIEIRVGRPTAEQV